MTRTLLLVLLTALIGCSSPDIRVTDRGASASATFDPVAIRYGSVEVTLATMPAYAQSEEIFVEAPDGTLSPLGPLWSDEPSRSVTLQVAQDLSAMSGALIAPEPWPFRDFADAILDVRVNDYFVTADGAFRLSGQYFVAPEDGGPDRAEPFSIEVPIGGEAALSDIARARTSAVAQLSRQIATEGLR
ncbi:MAG: ABC-type transport auxiliary lipoprotein family protein [Pseudomonadota bacterium]